jgi:Pyridoxamine 5'-phosphate oxidase
MRPKMPGYGLADADDGKGLLPWSWAQERLARARNYFLSTMRPDGSPHVMVVWGLFLDDVFQFSTSATSQKGKNLAANPRCVVCPGDADEAVILEGVAGPLEDAARARFAAEYKAKYDWDVSTTPQPIYVVRPRVVHGLIEETFTTSATRWVFD